LRPTKHNHNKKKLKIPPGCALGADAIWLHQALPRKTHNIKEKNNCIKKTEFLFSKNIFFYKKRKEKQKFKEGNQSYSNYMIFLITWNAKAYITFFTH
jgi:hypothetical protein